MIIAGTGHRPNKLGGYSTEARNNIIRIAIKALNQHKPEIVISGMALGWDQALAHAALHLKIPLHAYVPFKGQECMWPPESQKYYNKLLDKASVIREVCEPGYSAWKMQTRNEAMVDHCNLILALWNGTLGGTANCIRYAEKQNRSIINLWRSK